MNQSNCIVAQSGGPTVAINASLAGVIAGVKSSEKYDICYGAVNGILGILNENYLNLSDIFADDANLENLRPHLPCILAHAATSSLITRMMIHHMYTSSTSSISFL